MGTVNRLPSSARETVSWSAPNERANETSPQKPQSPSTSATSAPTKPAISWELGDETQPSEEQTHYVPRNKKAGVSNHERVPGRMYASPGDVLQGAPAYRMLDADTRRVLLSLSDGTNYLGKWGRWYLHEYLTCDSFLSASPEAQVHLLREFLANAKEWLPSLVHLSGGKGEPPGLPFTVEGPEEISNHPFASGTAPALKYVVKIKSHLIDVFIFKHSQDIGYRGTYRSIDEIARGIATVPEVALQLISKVQVDPRPSPFDEYWAQRFNDPNHLSVMSAGTDTIDVYPYWQKSPSTPFADFHHEAGHIVDHFLHISDSAEWQKAMADDPIPPSGYGMSSPGEDFAETFSMYFLIKDKPWEPQMQHLFAHRFKILDRYLKKQ